MQAIGPQFVFDLRRLAPWAVAYSAFWAWRALTFDLEGYGLLSWPSTTQGLAAILLLGALVSESNLFSRRDFWRTKPVDPDQLLGGRLIFLAVVLWLPAVVANFQILNFLEGSPLRLLVWLDVMTYQGLWLLSLLALVSLVRRPIEVVAIPVVIVFGLAIADWTLRKALDQLLFHDPRDIGRAAHQFMHTAVSFGLSVAVLLGLVALYRRQYRRAIYAAVCAALTLLAAVSLSLAGVALLVLGVLHRRRFLQWSPPALCALAVALVPVALLPMLAKVLWPPPQIDPPPDIELTLERDLVYPMYYDGSVNTLRTYLVPQNLPKDLGLSLLAAEGELTPPDGNVLEIRGKTEDSCKYPAELIQRVPTLSFRSFYSMLNCGADVPLYLLLRGDRIKSSDPLRGTLELRLRLKAFRTDAQRADATPGTTLHHGLETFVVHRVDPPLGGQRVHPRLHLKHFFLGNTRHPYSDHRGSSGSEHSLTATQSHIRLLDSANHEIMSSGSSGSTSTAHFNLGPYSRLYMGQDRWVPQHRRRQDGEALEPPHFQLLDLNRAHSREIAITLRIEDFHFAAGY